MRPRFQIHCTPTSAPWLNPVENSFCDLTTARLRRRVFRNVPDLGLAIKDYIATHDANLRTFIWTAKAMEILQKVIRANQRSSSK